MKRQNIADVTARLAAPGLPDLPTNGHEAVSLVVRGGELVAVVPQGTADGDVEAAAITLRGRLRLEDERVLTFQVTVGPGATSFEDVQARLHPDPHAPAVSSTSRLLARDIMSREIVTVHADALVEDAAKLLAYHSISGMPVEDPDGKIVGVVTEVDVIGHIGSTVSDVMSSPAITVTEDATVEEVAALLEQHRIRRVPVMRNGMVCGIVSRADIVQVMARPA